MLEGTQVFYWTVLVALRGSVTWEALRPDRALATDDAGFASEVAAKLLRAEAEHWGASPAGDLAARCHATLALLAQGCRVAGVPVGVLLEADLAALRSKAYLAPFFAGATGDGERAPGGQADTGPAVPSRPATP